MICGRWKICILLALSPALLKAQENPGPDADTVLYIYRTCKVPIPVTIIIPQALPGIPQKGKSTSTRQLLLTATGEAGYQYFDRNGSSDNLLLINSSSSIATLRMNLVYKEAYPFSIFFRYNQSAPFQLENQYEFTVNFDDRGYKELIRDKLAGLVKNQFLSRQAQLLTNYNNVFKQFEQQKQLLQSPAYIQQAVQNRFQETVTASSTGFSEAENPGMRLPSVTRRTTMAGINNNSPAEMQSIINTLPTTNGIRERTMDLAYKKASALTDGWHQQLEQQKDSLQGVLKKMEDSLSVQKQKYSTQLDSLNTELAELNSNAQLKKYADTKGLKDSMDKNRWLDVLMKTNLRVGKFILNNSELTVTNIFLHGISIKYGEEKFVQVSAGYYDFAFRELFNLRRDTVKRSKQAVVGIKLGKADGKNLEAINFYLGRKAKNGSLNGELRTVAGLSVERKFYLSKNLQLDLEIAKSTTRINNSTAKEQPLIRDLFGSFSSRTIGAFGALKTYLPKTKTDATISYRYWGQQFESFNASQYFNPQSNLAAKISQPFFNRKLTLTSGIRYTDFKSYGISSNIKSKTLFASVNATMRIKKLPVVSIGYYPGSQLYWMEASKLYEYFYYIFNTTISHYFTIKEIPVQAVVTSNHFFNKYSDSLVSSTQSYYSVFLTAWAGRFSYQANYSRQNAAASVLSTIETGVNYGGNKLRLGGTLKWNFTNGSTRLGYTGNIGLLLGKTGTVYFIYDKSFLPDRTGFFIPVTTGQIQIIKPLKFRIWQKG